MKTGAQRRPIWGFRARESLAEDSGLETQCRGRGQTCRGEKEPPWLSKPREEQPGAGSGRCELAGVQERGTASAMLSVGTELAPAPAWQSAKPAESTLGTPCGPQGGFLGLQNYVPSKARKLLL